MKKFLYFVVCVILALGAFAMVGCGSEETAFDGNYQEATVAEATTFAQDLSKESSAIDYSIGVEYNFDMSYTMTYGEETYTMDIAMEMNMIAVEGKLQMAGTMDATSNGETDTAKVYYVDDYFYLNGEADGETTKIKYKMSIDDFIGNYTDDVDISFSLLSYIEMAGEIEAEGGSIKFYIDNSDAETTKVKIELTEGEEANATIYLLYNADKELVGAKYDVAIDNGTEGSITMSVEIAPWSGTVSLPSAEELAEYLGY